MTRLFHVSDIHFGAEDKAALAWFAALVNAEQPDAVIVTGDLTMQARSHEFAAATEWLVSLKRPLAISVGNHDLPYFNPVARFMRPYDRYRALQERLTLPLELPGVAIVPLVTTARFQWRLNWSKGHVSARSLAATLAEVAAAPPGHLVIVAAHHPLVDAETLSRGSTRGGAEALTALARAGVGAVLSGHVHDPFDLPRDIGGRKVRLIGAGTLSERIRATPPSFNELRVEDGKLEVAVRAMG